MIEIPTWLIYVAAAALVLTFILDTAGWTRQRLTRINGHLTWRWYRPGQAIWHPTRGLMVVTEVDLTPALGCAWVYAESTIEGRPAAWLPVTEVHATVAVEHADNDQ